MFCQHWEMFLAKDVLLRKRIIIRDHFFVFFVFYHFSILYLLSRFHNLFLTSLSFKWMYAIQKIRYLVTLDNIVSVSIE